MSLAVPTPRPLRTTPAAIRRCGWRASLQLACAAAVLAAAGSGPAWSAPQPLHDATHAATARAQGSSMGAIRMPDAAAHATFVRLEGTATLGPLRPEPDGAADLSPLMWTSPRSAVARDGNLPQLLPVTPLRITSGFGRRHDPLGRGDAFHSGIDFAGHVGTPVHASGDGVVVRASYSKDYGNVVMIDHGHGVVSLYAHNSKLEVRTGDVVMAGEEIAKMGSTGRSTGPHLHFEVRQYGQRVDPGRFLAGL